MDVDVGMYVALRIDACVHEGHTGRMLRQAPDATRSRADGPTRGDSAVSSRESCRSLVPRSGAARLI